MRRSAPAHVRRLLAIPVALLALAVLAVAAPAAGAQTIVVSTTADTSGGSCTPTSGTCSLREALELIEEGETEATVKVEITATGSIDLGGEELTLDLNEDVESVEIAGPGASQLTVNGEAQSRVFMVNAESSIAISGMTIANGAVTGAALDGDGGAGILVLESEDFSLDEVRLTENRIESNREGGALALEEGDLSDIGPVEITDSRFDHNFSEKGGGAIYVDTETTVRVEGVELDHNEVEDGSGGAILHEEGELEVNGSTLTENSATEYGGGVSAEAPTTIERSTFNANSVPDLEEEGSGGGAIAQTGADRLTLRNSTVTANDGGAIFGVGVEITIRNSTIVDNSSSASPAAGIEAEQFVIQSTILSGNERGSTAADCDGTAFSQGNNLVGTTAGCAWVGAGGDITGADPELGPLGTYGGPTATMPPVSRESPVINAGENPQATDQRGRTRPVPGVAADTDIGSVEVQAPALEVADPPSVSPDTDLKSGETLTCEAGTWDTDTVTDPDTSFAWRVGGQPAGTDNTYVLSNADAGKPIVCEVTVDNGVLGASAETPPVQLQAGIAIVDPSELDFGSRRVGTGPSEPQTLVVENVGGADVEVAGATTTNDEFPIDDSDCIGVVLAAEESCLIEASFDPGAPGQQGSFVIVETTGGNPVAELTGKATDFSFSAAPASVAFGEQLLETTSETETVVVSNLGDAPMDLDEVTVTGTDPTDFELGAEDCSESTVEPGGECSVDVTFTPSAVGGRSAAISFSGDLNATVPMTGTGVAPALTVSPTPLNYGSHLVGTKSGVQAYTVTNVGSAPAEIDLVELSGAEADQFELGPTDTCTGEILDPGEECSVDASFAPTVVGEAEASLQVFGTAPTASALLIGTAFGLPDFSATPIQLDFGPVSIEDGPSPGESVTVSNEGTAPMEVETVTIEGADAGSFAKVFGGDSCSGATLDPGEECEVEINFDPSQTRGYSATLAFAGDDPGTVGLFGTGVAPELIVAPNPLDYGSHLVGTKSGVQVFTVTNVGGADAEIDSVGLSGGDADQFELGATDTCTGATLEPDDECTVEATFAPTVVGEAETFLQVLSSGHQTNAALSGTAFGEPDFSASPTQLDFGPVRVDGGPSSAESVTVTNEGTAAMEIDTVTVEGADGSAFAIVSGGDSCAGATLDPDEECEVEVTFDPAEVRGYAATLAFDGDEPGTVGLFGTGVAPALTVAPAPLDYGSHLVGTKSGVQTFTVTNVGGATASVGTVSLGGADPGQFEFGATNTCDGATLDPGDECTVEVSFAPTVVGEAEATLQVPSDAPTATSVLTGTAFGQPEFSASPTQIDFGPLGIAGGPSAAETVTIANAGTAAMDIDSVTIEGSGAAVFAIVSGGSTCAGATLAPDEECEVEVTFDPTATVGYSATLAFAGDDPGTVGLFGTGVAPEMLIEPNPLDFGPHLVGTKSGVQVFTVTNVGGDPGTLGTVTLAGADPGQFELGTTNTCEGATLDPDEECEVEVRFAPTEAGLSTASLQVSGDAPASAAISGTGTEPKFSAAPSSVDFGTLAVEDAPGPAETIVIANSGTGAMEIGPIFLAGTDPGMFAFEADGCSNQTLAAGADCEIDARFAPTGAGQFAANLVFPGTAPGTVALKGKGIAPKFSATPASLDFGSRQIGSGAGPAQTVTVSNEGSAPLTLGGATLGGKFPTSFAVLAGGDNCSGKTLAPAATCTVQTVFAPITPGNLEAELNFPGNASGGVILHGFGSEPPPPPTPPAPEPPVPPVARPTLRLAPHKGPLLIEPAGLAKIALICDSPSGAVCKGTVKVKIGKQTVSWRGKLKAGAGRWTLYRFGPAVREALTKKRKLKGNVTVSSAGGTERLKATFKLP